MRPQLGSLVRSSLQIKLAACAAAAVALAQTPPAYTIDTVAGSGPVGGLGSYGGDGGPAVSARLSRPNGVAADSAGNIFITDAGNNRIRKIDTVSGTVSTVAGNGDFGYGGDGGPAASARLNTPSGIAVDGAGNIFIADSGNYRIRKVDADSGIISTVAGNGEAAPREEDSAEGNSSGDGGPAVAARLGNPVSIAADGAGNLFIADSGNHSIRKVDADSGVISTVAGNGQYGYGGDDGPAAEAALHSPLSVAFDGAGNLLIADTLNNRIRKVDTDSGVISTVAGNGVGGGGGDGGPATDAQLFQPNGIVADGSGNIFIADAGNNRIRKIDTVSGAVSTVAGNGVFGYGGDDGPAADAQFNFPLNIAADGAGNLFIADYGNHRIRRLTPQQAVPPPAVSAGGIILASGYPIVHSISPNAIVSVFGQHFMPQGRTAGAALDAAGRVAVNRGSFCLEIGGKRAPLFYVSPRQINAQAPHDLPVGQATVTAVRGCGTALERRSEAASVTVAAVSPAFFNLPRDGRYPLAAQHGGGTALVGSPDLGAGFTPAAPGEIVTLYGTGFGPTEPAFDAGRIPGAASNLVYPISILVGGMTVPAADVLYAGAAGCCAGLYQFVLRLPDGLPDGDAAVTATVQDVSTPQGPFLTVRRQR